MHLLDVRHLTKRFHPQHPPVVEEVEFSVNSGEIFALLGPSGCGKTTTLRLIAGFETPERGEIQLEERSLIALPPERRQVGIVFQDYALFPHLSVLENVIFGLKKLPRHQRRRKAEAVLDLVGLTIFKNRMPHELSGGQQQRVALARAIAPEPKLILLDEPFSNLDAALRQATRSEVRALLKAAGMSALLVTHDQEEALSFADRLAVMRSGQIEQVGTPEDVYHQPTTPFVAQFLGRTNIISGEAHGEMAKTPLGLVPIHRPAKGSVLLSLRPEHLELTSVEPNQPSGEVIAREFKGHDLTYRVRIGSREYLAHTDYTGSYYQGAKVRLVAREPAVVLAQGSTDEALQREHAGFLETLISAG